MVVPTSTSRAPDARITSGTRKRAADLDQLAARDDHLAPGASAASASSTAAAQLLTTSASSAPVSAASSSATCSCREPRRALVELVLEVGVAARDLLRPAPSARRRQRRAAEVGVQHHAGRVDHRRSDGAQQRAHARRPARASMSTPLDAGALPRRRSVRHDAVARRSRSISPRTAATTAQRGARSSSPRPRRVREHLVHLRQPPRVPRCRVEATLASTSIGSVTRQV